MARTFPPRRGPRPPARPSLTLHTSPPAGTLTAPAPAAPTPGGGTLTLPHGRTITRTARGLFWGAWTTGGAHRLCAVDSRGERVATVELPASATADQYDEAERFLWELLDTADPAPVAADRPTLAGAAGGAAYTHLPLVRGGS